MNKKSYCTKKDNLYSFKDIAAMEMGRYRRDPHLANTPQNNK